MLVLLLNMRIKIISSLILGTCSFSSLSLPNVRADVSVQIDSPEVRQIHSFASHPEFIHNDDNQRSLVNFVRSTTSGSRLFRRGKHWTDDEEELLIELRGRQMPWDEILKSFPDRTWLALKSKHDRLTQDIPPTTSPRRMPWTEREDEILLDLIEKNKDKNKKRVQWRKIAGKIAENLPGKTVNGAKRRYQILVKGHLAPKAKKTSWTDEEDDFIVKALESGMKGKEISQSLGRTENAIMHRKSELKKLGRLDHIRGARYYTVADFKLMHELVNKGISWKDISAQYFSGRPSKNMKAAYKKYLKKKKNKNGIPEDRYREK